MDGDRASGPLGLRPGDPVRLKRLQANQAMNGLIGYFVKIETEDDGGRYVVELGKRGPVRVREINVEKVSPSRRSTRLATAAAAEAAALAEEPEEPKTKTPASKAKAKAKSMSRRPLRGAAKAKSAVKKTGNKVIKPKPAGGGGVFDVNMYKICSEPTLEVQDEVSAKWRPCQLYQNVKDGRIVIWYGGGAYEGLPPSKPYRFKGLSKGGRILFDGKNGELLDGDGEKIPTRRRPSL